MWGGVSLYFLPMLLIDRPSLDPISHHTQDMNVEREIYAVLFGPDCGSGWFCMRFNLKLCMPPVFINLVLCRSFYCTY